MSRETLFEIAYEMLKTTNPYKKDVTELKYTNKGEGKISLLQLVEQRMRQYDYRLRGRSKENLRYTYTSIAKAMVDYLEKYSAPFSFKLQTKKIFVSWLKEIEEAYDILHVANPAELIISKSEIDTGTALLKLLHSREGVTYEDIRLELNIGERAIQKDFIKLSPSMYAGKSEAKDSYVPFRIAGQPLHAKIELVPDKRTTRDKHFYTLNSVHPLVLQENIMQLSVLLKALCHQYYDYEDELSALIAIDVWSQMSDYAKAKMENYFVLGNPKLQEFIEILNDQCPDDHICRYHTEKELLDKIEMTMEQKLEYLMKANGRIGTIILKDGKSFTARRIGLNVEGKGYQAIDEYGKQREFTKDWIEEIVID